MNYKWQKSGEYSDLSDFVVKKTKLPLYKVLGDGFYQIKQMESVKQILLKQDKSSTITIVGDYDCDGVFSSSILYFLLQELGFTSIEVALPRRFTEGYGLSEKILARITGNFILCVDNGIAAHQTIRKAKKADATVVILDHHLPAKEGLPDADVVVDPSAISGSIEYINPQGMAEETSFSSYCGAGLAFKLAEYMLPASSKILKVMEAMCAIATIADVMPLVEDNHRIVKEGLLALSTYEGRTAGMYALLEALSLKTTIQTEDVGYKIAPCINAPGRLYDDGAMKAFRLITEQNLSKARDLVKDIIADNEKRKMLSEVFLKKANDVLQKEGSLSDRVLCVKLDKAPEGILGIIAGKLTELYNKPSLVLTQHGEGVLKGSGRSIESHHLKEMLDDSSEFLLGYGGHKVAAGLALKEECFSALKEKINETATKYPVPKEIDTYYYDFKIKTNEMPVWLKEIDRLAPFGEGNPVPVFQVSDCHLQPNQSAWFSQMKHDGLKFWLTSGAEALSFGLSETYFDSGSPKKLNLLGTLSWNYFGKTPTPQILYTDFKEQITTNQNKFRDMLRAKANERYT